MTNEEDLDDLPDYLDLKKTLPPEEYAARLKQAKEAIMKGLDNDTVLAAVRKVFPGRSNLACVAWYRMDLKRKGNNVPPLAGTPKALVSKAATKAAKKTKKAN